VGWQYGCNLTLPRDEEGKIVRVTSPARPLRGNAGKSLTSNGRFGCNLFKSKRPEQPPARNSDSVNMHPSTATTKGSFPSEHGNNASMVSPGQSAPATGRNSERAASLTWLVELNLLHGRSFFFATAGGDGDSRCPTRIRRVRACTGFRRILRAQ